MKAMLHFTSCNTHNQYIRMYLFLTSSSNHTGHTHILYMCRYMCVYTNTCTIQRAHIPSWCSCYQHRTAQVHTSTNQYRNVVLLDDSCTHLFLCKQTIPATPSQGLARTVYVIALAYLLNAGTLLLLQCKVQAC